MIALRVGRGSTSPDLESGASPGTERYHSASRTKERSDRRREGIYISAAKDRRTSAAVMKSRPSSGMHHSINSDIKVAMSPSKMITEQSLSSWRTEVTV